MPSRICDACGRDRALDGGRTCEKGHFVCKDCVYKGTTFLVNAEKKICPICKNPLR